MRGFRTSGSVGDPVAKSPWAYLTAPQLHDDIGAKNETTCGRSFLASSRYAKTPHVRPRALPAQTRRGRISEDFSIASSYVMGAVCVERLTYGSTRAGGGSSLPPLTPASHVVHFDRWWNPAVEDQATDRAYRIGQKRNVLVHKFVCRGTVEEKIDALLESKKGVAREILGQGDEVALTEMSNDEIMKLVSLDLSSAMGDAL
jgi:hypothetical protein